MKQLPISIRVSDDVGQFMVAPEPVVALNLMGLHLLTSDGFEAAKNVFWVDGIMGTVACKLRGVDVKRKVGRDLLSETLDYLCENENARPVIVIGTNGDVPVMTQKLGRSIEMCDLPWITTEREVASMSFPAITTDHVAFLAVGSPKQEWIADVIFQESGAKCFCIGGAVNMLEGREQAVPKIVQTCGMEWLFRLMSEPKRRFVRLFATLPRGVLNLRHANKISKIK